MLLDESSRWSFRQRARAWLNTVSGAQGGVCAPAFDTGGAQVLVMESACLGPGQVIDGFLLVRGDFSCGQGCQFNRPIYVEGSCDIGKGSLLDSVESDGHLHLSPGVRVRSLAGSQADIEIRSGCSIGRLAYSHSSIRLGPESSAAQLYAPRIETPAAVGRGDERSNREETMALDVPRPNKPINRGLLKNAGFDLRKLRRLSPDTWLYDVDLHLRRPVRIQGNLIVQGAFTSQPRSLFEGDVRAAGSLTLGTGSVARKDLSAEGDLTLGPGSIFMGNLRSDQMLRLEAGVRGLRAGKPVRAWSAGELVLGEGVVIRGGVSSQFRVHAQPPAAKAAAGLRTARGS